MRKILSIVIAVLMVSMMIPSMAFADAAISVEVPEIALVAGESFELTPAVSGSTVKLEVNANVFTISGGETANGINTLEAAAGTTFTVTVNAAIPAEPFTSEIRVSSADTSEKFAISVADRIIGDVNGDGAVSAADAAQILRKNVSLSVDATFNLVAADANGDGIVSAADAAQILRKNVSLSVDLPGLGVDYIGGNADVDVTTDPFAGSDTPVVPDEPAKVVGAASGVYAYYQNGTVYYTFTAGENAESYAISVNGVAVELDDATATSGSFAYANWNEGADNTISVVAKAEGAEDAEAATTTIIVADANGALAQWLNANGLNDVTITVYEIQ